MIFSQLCRRARQAQGIASAFGTPVHQGRNDSVVADYRRIPSGSRGGGRAGGRLRARRWRGGGDGAPWPRVGGRGGGRGAAASPGGVDACSGASTGRGPAVGGCRG